MLKRLELHNHTTESDSSLTCLDLIEHMEADRVDAFALTDHNTISGHRKAAELLRLGRYHTKCIYGMEYTTYYGHILCFLLNEYVPWDSINFHKPELLFQAVKEKGAIAGIPHPFSFGYPFARGCRFEMTVHDYSNVDFIEVFNNPEPLHEVNERGFLWWEELVLSGEQLAATCGMDLHGKWSFEGQYATFIEGEPEGDLNEELRTAFEEKRTWISRGPLLLWTKESDGESLRFSLADSHKPGSSFAADKVYSLSLRTRDGILNRALRGDSPLILPLSQLPGYDKEKELLVIPRLYESGCEIEQLVCIAPVIR